MASASTYRKDGSFLGRIYFPSILLIIFLGLVFRVRYLLTGRSLWLDEAMLALNIVNRSFGGLFQQPMEYGQSSPIGYVISVKAITLILGDSEYALRLYSLLAGCIAFILMALISKQVLGKAGSLIALALFAFVPDLIYYTAETKQYISDVFTTTALLWLFQRHLNKPVTQKDFVILGVTGAVILWFSHPVVFVAAGIGITLFIHHLRIKDWAGLIGILLCGITWGISLVFLYFINLRHLASSELLQNYWQEGFMALPPWSNPGWFVTIWTSFLQNPLGVGANPLIVFGIFVMGLVHLLQRNWQIGLTIILSLVFSFIASGLHIYPLAGRMMLFIIPLFTITISAGIIGIGSLVSSPYWSFVIRFLPALYLIWVPFVNSLDGFLNPKYIEHMKPTLEYLSAYKKDNDLIYVYYNAGPAFRFYAPKFRLDDSRYIIGSDYSSNPEEYYREISNLNGNKRVWLIFSHVLEKDGFNEKDHILANADLIGEMVREFRVPSTSVYLFLYNFNEQ